MRGYKRFTEKRNGKNVIPLLNMVCGVDLPHWCIESASDIRSYLSGDAVDRLAELEDKIENGTLKEVEVVKPNCIIDKEKLFVDFICQKCNSVVSFVEVGMLGLIDKSDLSEAQKVENIEQLYPNYCSSCGVKLKELQNAKNK